MSGLWARLIRASPRGAVAQLGADLHGMEGVRGSNPLSSTKFPQSVARQAAPYESCWLNSVWWPVSGGAPNAEYLLVTFDEIPALVTHRMPIRRASRGPE